MIDLFATYNKGMTNHNCFLSYNHTERQLSGSFEVLTLGLTLGNGSGTNFGESQCIPMGPCRLTRRLTLSVVMPLTLITKW